MTLKSMTGFARAEGVHGDTSWSWEARSVEDAFSIFACVFLRL